MMTPETLEKDPPGLGNANVTEAGGQSATTARTPCFASLLVVPQRLGQPAPESPETQQSARVSAHSPLSATQGPQHRVRPSPLGKASPPAEAISATNQRHRK